MVTLVPCSNGTLKEILPEALNRRVLYEFAQLVDSEEREFWKGNVASPGGQVVCQQLHHLLMSRDRSETYLVGRQPIDVKRSEAYLIDDLLLVLRGAHVSLADTQLQEHLTVLASARLWSLVQCAPLQHLEQHWGDRNEGVRCLAQPV